MLRIIQNTSAVGARSYYATPDYYIAGNKEQELPGIWRGEAAERLGLTGLINQQEWAALCDNLHPYTRKLLTARRDLDRTVGYDFNFHVPKSLSILYALTHDERLLRACRSSVRETMEEIESEMQTRVRLGGKQEDRVTGNMVWGEFVHFTSRPVDGVPDPHLHVHCFAHNVTFDTVEKRWKAGQFRELKRDAPYHEAKFHARLARKLQDLGIEVEQTKNCFELKNVSKKARDKFSRRTALIESLAKEKGITSDTEKDSLGAKTREKKQKNLSMDELRREWRARLTEDEQSALAAVAGTIGAESIPEQTLTADVTAEMAISHCFERKSVVPQRVLLTEAIKRSVGKTTAQTAEAAIEQRNLIWGEREGRCLVTTREVLGEETRMLSFARQGRGTCARLGIVDHQFKREKLNEGQRGAVRHVLTSSDRVMVIRGGAGTGKTTTMQEAVEAIESAGTKVFTFAPSAAASRGVLVKEGFKDADTIARLLQDEKLQEKVRGSVLWVDEAGLLGVRTMAQLFDLAEKLDTRVILSGDYYQHGSVERGAALRLLETEAGLLPAKIKEIVRQDNEYKLAVKALSDGRTADAFKKLNQMGWIKESKASSPHALLAGDYAKAIEAKKSVLVVSPTHAEGDAITQAIRAELKERGYVKGDERAFPILRNAQLTEAERADAVNFNDGDVIEFHKNGNQYKKGDRITVGEGLLPLSDAARFQAYRTGTVNIAAGDKLRITKNGKSKDGQHRLNNGALFSVKRFTKEGDIVLHNGWTIDRDYGHFDHGVCVTSHASQGSTVHRVLIGLSSQSFAAANEAQFYVSVSRGREQATIYTDSKADLLEAVSRSDERLSATEFANGRHLKERAIMLQRMQMTMDASPNRIPEPQPRKEIDYER